MSLREQLRRAVASCAPIETQHATFGGCSATDTATPAQQPPANPHGIRKVGATHSATPAQLEAKNSATFDPPEVAQSCAPSCAAVASELTAHRQMKKLLAAAMRCCDRHGDGAEARAEMERQCLEIPQHLRGDLLHYFNSHYPEQRS